MHKPEDSYLIDRKMILVLGLPLLDSGFHSWTRASTLGLGPLTDTTQS